MADDARKDEMTPDEFDLAFDQEAVRGLTTEKDEKGGESTPPDAGGTPPEAKQDPPADDPAKAEADKAAADAKAAQEKADADKAAVDAKAVKERQAQEKKAADEKAAAEAKAAQEKAEAERKAKLETSEDEKKLLEEVNKDFPDVAKALAIQERILAAKFEQMLEARLGEVTKQIEPVAAAAQASAKNAYEAEILGKHADAFEILPKVDEWIATLPAVLQRAYNHVLDNPVPAKEVIELLDAFKVATAPPPAGEPTEEQKKAEAERLRQEEEKKRKLESQEGIRGRRSERKDTGPLSFEAAFDTVA